MREESFLPIKRVAVVDKSGESVGSTFLERSFSLHTQQLTKDVGQLGEVFVEVTTKDFGEFCEDFEILLSDVERFRVTRLQFHQKFFEQNRQFILCGNILINKLFQL